MTMGETKKTDQPVGERPARPTIHQFLHLKTPHLQNLPNHTPHNLLIIHHQHNTPTLKISKQKHKKNELNKLDHNQKINTKNNTLPQHTLHNKNTTIPLDNTHKNHEAQTPPHELHHKKELENTTENNLIHTATRILNLQKNKNTEPTLITHNENKKIHQIQINTTNTTPRPSK